MTKKLIEQTLSEARQKFIAHEGLPNGTRVELKRKSGKGRAMRGDQRIKRRKFGRQLDDSVTVARLLAHFASAIVEPSLKSENVQPQMIGPDGKEVPGNKILKTIRRMDALPTPEDIEIAEGMELDVAIESAKLCAIFDDQLDDCDVDIFARAVLRALRASIDGASLAEAQRMEL